MKFRARHKNARISARKVRRLADLVRGKFVDDALDILRYQRQRGAVLLAKVIRSALGNAQDPGRGGNVQVGDLIVVDARVDGGPIAKRVRPRARGMAFMILRRSCHIDVTLGDLAEV